MSKGIDLSSYNGSVNWDKVKKAGVDFVILRGTVKKGTLDTRFNENYEGARKKGIAVGVYKYSYALSVFEAKEEAETLVKTLDNKELGCGVWLDVEDKSQRSLSKSLLTDIINAFREVIESAGYNFGIYCNLDWYKNVIDVKKFACPFWIARYPSANVMNVSDKANNKYKPVIKHTLYAWQYSSKGRVPGINGYVDLNDAYVGLCSAAVYYPKYTGDSTSIVEALNSLKIASNFSYRKRIAKANNITGYMGFASQNTKMLTLLKAGKLVRV